MRINSIVIIYAIIWLFSIILFLNKKDILKKFFFLTTKQISKFPLKGKYALAIPFLITLLHEMIFIITGVSLLSTKDITELFYDLSMFATGEGGADENYSEGYFEGLSEQQIKQMGPRDYENRKFDKILELLGAKEGSKILDLGCGTSTFGAYCKTKGIEVIGVTVSSEQVKHAKSKGLVAYRKDFKEHIPEFDNSFDHIVMMGSSEHVAPGSGLLLKSYDEKSKILSDMLKMCNSYLKPNGTIFYSGIHINPKYYKTAENFTLARAYGGLFQLDHPDYDIVKSFENTEFKGNRMFSRDSTRDYYLATVHDENHFGQATTFASSGMLKLLAVSIIYPFAFYQYIYYTLGLWMWMWDGNLHLGADPKYTFEEDKEKRPCTLYWHVYRK